MKRVYLGIEGDDDGLGNAIAAVPVDLDRTKCKILKI